MNRKLLFVASTRSHILHFHLPYLNAFQEQGWTVHGAWEGTEGEVPFVDAVTQLPFEKKMTAPGNFHAARILRKQIKQEGYDLLIVHTSLAAFFARLAVLGLKKRPRVINMVHGYLFDEQTDPLKRMVLLTAERLTAPVTDLLLTMNEWDYQTAQKYRLGRRVGNVPGIGVRFERLDSWKKEDGAALRHTLEIPADAVVLIYPAEFSSRKSQKILLQALRELPEQVMLVLPGNGVLLEECKELARELGVDARVRFPGYVTEMGPWYQMADAAISASRIEGLPFNIMEAMYAALPVVASAVKGHTDLICSGETGFLYPYGDWRACAEQVQKLLDNRELAQSLGAQARVRVLQYGLEQVFPQVMEQYESVLEKKVTN